MIWWLIWYAGPCRMGSARMCQDHVTYATPWPQGTSLPGRFPAILQGHHDSAPTQTEFDIKHDLLSQGYFLYTMDFWLLKAKQEFLEGVPNLIKRVGCVPDVIHLHFWDSQGTSLYNTAVWRYGHGSIWFQLSGLLFARLESERN